MHLGPIVDGKLEKLSQRIIKKGYIFLKHHCLNLMKSPLKNQSLIFVYESSDWGLSRFSYTNHTQNEKDHV